MPIPRSSPPRESLEHGGQNSNEGAPAWLPPVQVLDRKTNSLPETLGNESSSLAVVVVTSKDNCSLKFSIHPPSEVSAIDKAADGIKLSPVNMTIVTACDLSDGTVSNSYVVSALDSRLNHRIPHFPYHAYANPTIQSRHQTLRPNQFNTRVLRNRLVPLSHIFLKTTCYTGGNKDTLGKVF